VTETRKMSGSWARSNGMEEFLCLEICFHFASRVEQRLV
jgi:hypothetical protein